MNGKARTIGIVPLLGPWVSTGADRVRKEDPATGDRVFCNWMGEGFYNPGEIARQSGNAIVVHYDDGYVEATTLACVRVE